MPFRSQDLGVAVWEVSSAGVQESIRGADPILCPPTFSVVWVDHAGTHEDVSNQEGRRKSDRELDQERMRAHCERAASIVASWPEWKRKAAEAALAPIPEDAFDYLNYPG